MAVIRSAQERPVVALGTHAPLSELPAAGWKGASPAALGRIETAGRSVGRLEAIDHPTLAWLGAAFVVAPGLVITTRHIADTFIDGRAGFNEVKAGFKVGIRFSDEDISAGRLYPVVACALRHPVLDVAILRINDEGAAVPEPLTFNGAETLVERLPLAVVAYFAPDPRASADSWPLSDMKSGAKYLALGRSLGFATWREQWMLTHDCSTSAGSSGSPVLDLETGRVIGIHTGGQQFEANYAVPASEIAREKRIRDLGLIFSEGSRAADPLAYADDWPAEQADQPAPAVAGATGTRESFIDLVDQRLADSYSNLDDLISFIRNQSSEHANAVDAQPGRSRVDNARYRRALVEALDRRGLLDKSFLQKIGLTEEASPSASARSGVVTADVPQFSAAAPPAALPVETIEALEKIISPGDMNILVRGSPYMHLLTDAGGLILPPATALSRLAHAQDSESREALIWLLNRVRVDGHGDTHPAVTTALEALGAESEPRKVLEAWNPSPTEMVDPSFLRKGQIVARSVCVVLWRGGGSTGWLVAPDLVVAPAHLVGFAQPEQQARLATIDDINPAELRVEFEDRGPNRPRTACVVDRVESYDHGSDLMIVKLATPLRDREPLQIRTSRVDTGPVAMIHHPHLGRRMLSIHGGRLLSNDGHETRYLLATTRGSAGGPIFDETWHVLATHRAFVPSRPADGVSGLVKVGTSVEALVDHIRGAASYASLWRRITGAQRQLRSIDPGLMAKKADGHASQPIVITVVDASTELPPIKGLAVSMRSDDLITATASAAAIRQLAETPGVVAINASGAGGALECRISVPFIGAPAIHTDWNEKGDQAIIALIDDGIDPFHQAFVDDDGKSRIDLYWDQQDRRAGPSVATVARSADGESVVATYGLQGGAIYTRSDIDELMAAPPASLQKDVFHGTAVGSIAAGRSTGNGPRHFPGGVAPRAHIIAIRHDTGGASIGYSAGHINALNLIDRRATDLGLPVVVNISNGMNAGAHNGTADVELRCTAFTETSQKAGRIVVKSAGNERNSGHHAQFTVSGANRLLRWNSRPKAGKDAVKGGPERLEVWFGTHNVYEFSVQTPDRTQWYVIPVGTPVNEKLDTRNSLSALYSQYASEPTKMSKLVIEILPGDKDAVQSGEWSLLIKPIKYRDTDDVHAWLELHDTRDVRFMDNVVAGYTITVPGTSSDVITVAAAAADSLGLIYPDGSMGPALGGIVKPDLVAPGVSIAAAQSGTQTDLMPKAESGTSFAAPHVSGAIALALSAFHKKPPRNPGRKVNQSFIRVLLLDSTRNFRPRGDAEAGFGELDAAEFFNAVRANQ